MEAITHFQHVVKQQDRYHPGAKNQFAIAPLLCPPKLVWYADNGRMPEGHLGNRREELEMLNNDNLSFKGILSLDKNFCYIKDFGPLTPPV